MSPALPAPSNSKLQKPNDKQIPVPKFETVRVETIVIASAARQSASPNCQIPNSNGQISPNIKIQNPERSGRLYLTETNFAFPIYCLGLS